MSNVNSRTALITGASSGIGAEFARQLAGQGYNLVLTARRLDRLQSLAQELAHAHHITVEVLVADLADEAGIQAVETKIRTLADLDILVNNAGFGVKGLFYNGSIEKHLAMIQVHIIASVRLTRQALPGMIERDHGGIINLASVAAFTPAPGATYGSTKAYLVAFSKGLQMELNGSDVNVQALCPGFTYTEFHDVDEMDSFKRSSIPRFLWLSAPQVVSTSLRDLRRGRVVCVPGWQYKIISSLAQLVSYPLIAFGYRLLRKR